MKRSKHKCASNWVEEAIGGMGIVRRWFRLCYVASRQNAEQCVNIRICYDYKRIVCYGIDLQRTLEGKWNKLRMASKGAIGVLLVTQAQRGKEWEKESEGRRDGKSNLRSKMFPFDFSIFFTPERCSKGARNEAWEMKTHMLSHFNVILNFAKVLISWSKTENKRN